MTSMLLLRPSMPSPIPLHFAAACIRPKPRLLCRERQEGPMRLELRPVSSCDTVTADAACAAALAATTAASAAVC
eukprot:CAMPEP_0172721186 /NCGR_PEP_ID=MMETSP1074-20121228/78525_1 /TAXON_ID=2916 /ORGANISM="Ceratium fusus, Strain PA161109" /LENGTH=74 /DNA_ID=CAMNT_0013546871 /DNA_START=38 /DNA_END=260 /DNA_ORIENTATION=-